MKRFSKPEPKYEEEPAAEEEPAVEEEPAAEAVPEAAAEEEAEGTIVINQDEVKKRAYLLSQAKKSYDDCVWLWAEQELKLGKALAVPLAPNVKKVVVDASKIIAKPKESDIKKLAAELAKKKAKIQDIHWFVAERQFIVDKAMGH
ncbi:MAG TPA: hypothetical protein VKM55_20325 [Candidatus Lokiarchaeia archaeon]|nr:hypothetical protein [Candidatus Lokiarchaeia archaeon]